MQKRLFLLLSLASAALLHGQTRSGQFTVVEASISDMRAALEQHRITSHELVSQYLIRIALYEDKLHAALTVNPRALEDAEARDQERSQGRVRGPFHGIPIALKDNIHTTDLPTTGGALVFDGCPTRPRWSRTCARPAPSSLPRPV